MKQDIIRSGEEGHQFASKKEHAPLTQNATAAVSQATPKELTDGDLETVCGGFLYHFGSELYDPKSSLYSNGGLLSADGPLGFLMKLHQ